MATVLEAACSEPLADTPGGFLVAASRILRRDLRASVRAARGFVGGGTSAPVKLLQQMLTFGKKAKKRRAVATYALRISAPPG